MTKYLVTGDGRRLLTGSGMPLTADEPGDAHWPAGLEPAELSFAAAPVAVGIVVAVGLAAASLGFAAEPVSADVISDESVVRLEPAMLSFDAAPVAASLSVPVGLDAATLAFDAASVACGAIVAVGVDPAAVVFAAAPVDAIIARITAVALAPASLQWQCSPVAAVRVSGVSLQAASVAFDVQAIAAQRMVRLPVALQKATLGFNAQSITAAQSTASKFRSYWLAAYGTRQTVLNAIDANNRYLAKQAGDKAQATADALVITDTRVQQMGDTVTAQGTRIEQVSASIPGSGGNLVKRSDFSGLSASGWINATVAQAPGSGAGSQPSTTYQGPYITTVPGGTYEDNWFPVTPDEVFDVAANVYNTTNNTGRFGLHFQDRAGNNLDWLSPAAPAAGAWVAVAGQVRAPVGAWRARAWLTAGSGGNNIRITQPDVRRQGATAGANSKALSQIEATVTQQGDKITSQGQAITNLQSSVAGKADASALSALTTTVTQQGDKITSQGQAITAVSATAAGKNTTYMQATEPVGTTERPLVEGDLWINTVDNNRLRRWTGFSWQGAGDMRIGTTASAVTDLTARVDVNEQGVAQAKATWGVYLTAGNVISGVQSINNGIVAEFNVMAHVFRLLSPAGADGMEIQDGYIRIWKGNSQTIIGNRFGVSGQGLMKWFGPNIGAAACTKANATSWEDDQGNAHFGGSLSAGILRNGAQSTQIGSNATVETGIFTTLGRAKSVTYSLSYTNIFTTASNLGGSTSLSATLILERSIDGGGWVEVSRRTVTGNRVFDGYEPGVGYGYSFNIGGSSTYTDNTAGSSATFNYRVRIADVVGWPYQRPEGGSGSFGRQSLTILSIEQ